MSRRVKNGLALAALGALGLSAAALSCADARQPAYTRMDGPAPEGWDRAGPVLAVFWATWCPPCREELPSLRALARDAPGGLTVATFGQDQGDAAVLAAFGGEPPPELGFVRDQDHAIAHSFGVYRLPAAFLVHDGKLLAHFSGPRDWNTRPMRRLLVRLLAEGRSESPPGQRPSR